jgi:hypothetical protein
VIQQKVRTLGAPDSRPWLREIADFTPKFVGDTERFSFAFAEDLELGETIASATWTVTVLSGVDPAAATMPQGPTKIDGAYVHQLVGGGLPGVTYKFSCTVVTSGGETVTKSGHCLVSYPG